jgi:NADH dehydrogenase
VRQPYAAHFLPTMGEVGQIHVLAASIRSDGQVAQAVAGAHAVVNLVGASPPFGGEGFRALHMQGAARVADAAMAAGVRDLVQISVLGTSLESPSKRLRQRAHGEAMVRDRFPAASILRAARAFGPDDRFFNRIAGRARVAPFFLLPGGGKQRLQPVFAGDIAKAILRAVDNPAETRGRTYELAGPSAYSMAEIIQFVLRETRRERPVLHTPGRANPDELPRKGALSFYDLGIAPTPVTAIVPSHLWRFRPKGQYDAIEERPVRLASSPAVAKIDSATWTG